MKLYKVFKAGACEMDVWVIYDADSNTVEEILSVSITWAGLTVDASDLMVMLFDSRLNDLINETDWREVAYDEVINEVFEN